MGILRRLKILVSAVQFRPGTPGNSNFHGGNGDSAPSRLSGLSTESTLTGTPAAQRPTRVLGPSCGQPERCPECGASLVCYPDCETQWCADEAARGLDETNQGDQPCANRGKTPGPEIPGEAPKQETFVTHMRATPPVVTKTATGGDPAWFGPTPPPSSPGDFAGLPQGWG